MKIRKVLLLITALAVLLTLSACRREKYYVSSEALETVMSDELYFGVPDYIVRGTVTKMVEEYFTAPDGPSYENAHVTVYELEITESYKGTLSEETVLLKIINGGGLSVNMYLYGEDGDYAGSFVVGISRCVAAPSLVGFNFQASVVVLCAADVVVQQCPVLGQNL